MRALDRKLLRDLGRMRGQAVAIAVLVACAVSVLVGSCTTERALRRTADAFYEDQAFADVFAGARRVPARVAREAEALPGVTEAEARVVGDGTLELPGAPLPAAARLVSIPPDGARLNRPYVRTGRDLAPGARDEALVSEGFAEANGLAPGDALVLTVNGRRQRIRVVGVALSPEHVMAIRPGEILPDDRHFGVLWLPRDALEAALDLEGAFDDLALRLAPGADREEVIADVDRLLARYGGLGAHGRDLVISHRFLADELRQLRAMAWVLPAIFLGVAAFLLSVVTARVVATERPQIGMLRALGYPGRAVAAHYAKLVAGIAAAGALAGALGGELFGRMLAQSYRAFYRFPRLVYEPAPEVMALGAAVAIAAALAGAAGSVRRAARLPPAEAMRPEPPAAFRATALERCGAFRVLAPATRMAVRNVSRRPVRALLATAGLSSAVAVLVAGAFTLDALDAMAALVFEDAQRQDATVTFTLPTSRAALHELRALPGVLRAEGFRAVAVTLRSGHRAYRTGLVGAEPGAELQRAVGEDGVPVPLPARGLVLSAQLARILRVAPGDPVRVEALEGRRPARSLPLAATVDDVLGVSATLSLAELNRLMGDGDLVGGAWLSLDPGRTGAVQAALRGRPRVAGVFERAAAIRSFRESVAGLLVAYAAVLVAFAVAIAAGVVYNAARIAFAERSRELATLRVLGFTRGETYRVLLGEVGVELVTALPLGCALGWLFAAGVSRAGASDLFRIPVVVLPRTYLLAIGVTLAAALGAALLARRWIARLDLVEVLKSRE